jgi:hypothetical protein
MSKAELRIIAEIAAKLVEITKCPDGEASGLKHFNIGTKGTKHVGKRTYGHGNKRLYQPV